jgi:eukaryotic-like serine/threonine-protein kinase
MPAAHDRILQSFSNISPLKQGGQKTVYRATDGTHGEVVVKIGNYASASGLERIRREVQVLRDIDSRYYPRNLEFRTEPPNLFVVVEEYVPSEPLTNLLGSFSAPAAALCFVAEVIKGLDLMWQRRVVHRDIKPDNLLVLPDRTPKIIDLGIARLLDADSLTGTINARGPCTPNYAAPEQLKNRKAQIDQRTDQFGLGIVLVQLLLSGRHPFDPRVTGAGDSIPTNILAGAWARSAVAAVNLPRSYRALIERLLGPEPHNRYRTTATLVAAIRTALGEIS